MSWRIIVISRRAKLDYQMGYIRSDVAVSHFD